jgi:hypothetical protein
VPTSSSASAVALEVSSSKVIQKVDNGSAVWLPFLHFRFGFSRSFFSLVFLPRFSIFLSPHLLLGMLSSRSFFVLGDLSHMLAAEVYVAA